jgi:feruloyl esterase
MKRLSTLRSFAALLLGLSALSINAQTTPVAATWDTDEVLTTPVTYRHIHGLIYSHIAFQILLPVAWNGKVMIFTRGFSGTELSTGAFQTAALTKGYAFASCDEGWLRTSIKDNPQDDYYDSRSSLVVLTVYTNALVKTQYGKASTRTLLVGGSNGGHHTRWMVEAYPKLFDGGISGYGYNSQFTQWGGVATCAYNYGIIASRIDDIIAKRAASPIWDPFTEPLSPPLTAVQLKALGNIYDIPVVLDNGFAYNVGRWPGSEAQWKANYNGWLGYLRDSIPRWDETFNPNGGPLTDEDLTLWDPTKSPVYVQRDLRREDDFGTLLRPLILMAGAADPIVGPGESAGYKKLVEQQLGPDGAEKVLAVYFIAGMGHGGTQYDALIPAQIDALEGMIDYQQSNGSRGAPAPAMIGIYPREPIGAPAGPESAALTGSIDVPADGAIVTGDFVVSGWARIPGSDLGVTVLIDGAPRVAIREARVPRPDVQAAIPSLGDCSTAGYEISFAFQPGDNGEHVLSVVFSGRGNLVRHYPSRKFTWMGRISSVSACADLTQLTFEGNTTITAATAVTSGSLVTPANPTLTNLPAFCRVQGTSKPTSDSNISFEVWLPSSTWNGKFLSSGEGGYAGALNYTRAGLDGGLDELLRRGYATASTDTGHVSSDQWWAVGHPEKAVDYLYRSKHLVTVAAKGLIKAFYGTPASHSYFNSCSNGGRQGLMEVQRYPDDYDGVVVGAPWNFQSHSNAGFVWDAQALSAPGAAISASKLPAIKAAVLAACDGADGLVDGVIADPSRCAFDPAVLLCQGVETNACLTQPQLAALRAIYAGPTNPRTSAQIFPGFALGGEAGWTGLVANTTASGLGQGYFANLVFENPTWDYRTFNFDSDMAYADFKVGIVGNAIDPDLSAAKERKVKIIQYHGWADQTLQSAYSPQYYESVVSAMGSLSKTQEFYRLFMVPGMTHCYFGSGATSFGGVGQQIPPVRDPTHDIQTALEHWVEDGVAPEGLIATKYVDDAAATRTIMLTRPLCLYPLVPRYKGIGDPNDAKSFMCD